MAVGLSLPVTVSANGGFKLVDGEENNKKIISLSLGDGDNENAFNQDITFGDFLIFKLEEQSIRGEIMGKLRKIFKKFQSQNRFKLLPETIDCKNDSATQEYYLEFKYHDIESDKIETFQKKLGVET